MEPFAPESLSPGVLPDSGLQPVKVAQDRMGLEMKANQLSEAAKQAKKAEEQKVKEGFNMPDFGKVYYRHKQAGEMVYNENLLKPLAQIEKNWADNPTNRDMNPNEIGTPAYMQKEKVINDAVQFVKRSADIQAQFDDMLKQYGAREDIDPTYLQDLTDWAGSEDALFKGVPAPTPEIYWNEGEAYKNSFGQIQAEKRGSERPTGDGYTTSIVTETITPDDIKAKAISVEADPIFRANLERKVNNLDPAQRATLAVQAKQSGMSLLAQQAYNDNIHYARRDAVQTLQSDPTYMWGKGLENDQSKASLFVEQARGMESGELKGGIDIDQTWMSGLNPQGDKGVPLSGAKVYSVWNNLNYSVKEKKNATGNVVEVPMKIRGVIVKGGKRAIVYEDPNGTGASVVVQKPDEPENTSKYKMTPWMNEDEFATEVVGKIPDANKGILPSKDVITYAQEQYKTIKGKEGNIDLQSGGANPFDKPKGQPQAKTKF